MSTETGQAQKTRSLEDELDELAADEKQLKRRLETTEIAVLLTAFLALIISIVAAVVALSNVSDHTTIVTRAPASSAPHASASGMASGMGGARNAATARTINVQLGEMFVRPSASSISAGRVTFVARNTGQLTHELMVERMPIKMDGPGKPTESAAQAMIKDMMPGGSGRTTVKLTPGTYMLFCNVPGHYAAGQHTTFTVTR